ncbi:hypothetical protein ACO9S2_01900 [Nitrospira sp. NS4]
MRPQDTGQGQIDGQGWKKNVDAFAFSIQEALDILMESSGVNSLFT